jgi:hypothetical protein
VEEGIREGAGSGLTNARKLSIYYKNLFKSTLGGLRMSKTIVPEMVPKEPWMTEKLQTSLKQLAKEGKITCVQAHNFAHEQSIELDKMRLLLDFCGIKLKECQLGCF